MKTILNILIAASVLVIMSDCEANAHRVALDYTNSIMASSGVMIFGFLRVFVRDFVEFLTRPQ